MDTIIITTLVVAVLIALNAFFSLAETALTGASRGRMTSLEKEGDPLAARVNRLNEDREGLIGSVLLGANLVVIAATAISTSLFNQQFGPAGAAIATLILTPILLVFGEVMPKSVAITSADAIARRVAVPIHFMVIVLRPVMVVLTAVVRFLLRLFGIKAAVVDTQAALEEIRGAVELGRQEGHLEKSVKDRLGGVLDLDELSVGEVMIHRRSMKTLDIGQPTRDIILEAIATPHSRLPLYRDEQENIIGILHAKDLLAAISEADGDLDAIDIEAILRKPWYVPETTTLQEQLEEFLKLRNHFALVVDEYGALEGLITLEDILEEIVGEIVDEHDVEVQGVRPQPDGSVNVDGWVPVRDLNRAMEWALPDEEAVTVAGLVIHESQMIPTAGQEFSFHGYRFQVLRKARNQIMAIRITPEVAAAEPEDAASKATA